VIQFQSYTEKNAQVLLKHLQLFSSLVERDNFKFENHINMICFTLDKYIDRLCEQQAEQTYFAFLKRNKNEDFNLTLSLLIQKQGYYNVQALGSHNHLSKRLKLLTKITSIMKGEILTQEQCMQLDKYYPLQSVCLKMQETLLHQNGNIRQQS